MDVTLNKINPEFAALLRKVRSIHAVTGGADSQTKTELKKLDSFDGMRGHIVVRLNHFEELCSARDAASVDSSSRDYVRMKNQVNVELSAIDEDIKKLGSIHEKDMRKRKGKFSANELVQRKEALDVLSLEFKNAHRLAKGYEKLDPTSSAAGAHAPRITLDDVQGGGTLPGANAPQEEVTGQQRLQLQQIHAQMAEQDDLLDQIADGVQGLHQLALGIQDVRNHIDHRMHFDHKDFTYTQKYDLELEEQNKIIEETGEKIDHVQTRLDAANDRLSKAVKILESKSTNICIYGICCVILLAILTVLYNMFVG